MTDPLEFDPGQPVQKYSKQLPAGKTTFELRNPAGDADAKVALYGSDGSRVYADVTVTAQTVRIEVDPSNGVGICVPGGARRIGARAASQPAAHRAGLQRRGPATTITVTTSTRVDDVQAVTWSTANGQPAWTTLHDWQYRITPGPAA